MKANEFLHKKDVAYMNRLSTSLDFDKIVSLMEEYAALRIHDVVGRSEQLLAFFKWYCNYKNNIHEGSEEKIIKEWIEGE